MMEAETAKPNLDDWDNDYLDALIEALDRRRQERLTDAAWKVNEARLAVSVAQKNVGAAIREYGRRGGNTDRV